MLNMNPRPPFMNGLLTARGILVALKEKKMKQTKQKNQSITNENRDQIERIPQAMDKQMAEEQLQESLLCVNKLSKKQQLSEKINLIGRDLYELHQENQTFEIIFDKLTEHYQQNHKIVEDNEYLKRKSYQLEEKIKHFKSQIKENYQKIEVNEKEGYEIQSLLQKYLEEFLINQKERALIVPLPKVTPSKVTSNTVITPPEEGAQSTSINLNWRNLSQKSIKKPAARKPKAQDIRQTLFNSQIYNI